MGGPFRAIVGGADQNMSFAPAQAIQLDNYSTQYGHLVQSDVFVAPGQIGMVVLVDGITSEKFRFEAPPGASQAAPTPGQICLIRTFDEAAGPGAPPPLAPGVGVLLPIGLDSPQHFHQHNHGAHLHTHSAGHAHSTGGELAAHTHSLFIQNDNTATPLGLTAGGAIALITGGGFAARIAMTDANGDSGHSHGNTGSSSPGNTDNATPATDTTLENVPHTHP